MTGEVKFITTRYAGRVFDVVSYETTAIIEVPTTVDVIMEAEAEVKQELLKQHPTASGIYTQVQCGFGFSQQTIVVVAFGNVYNCIQCGGDGHKEADCPTKKV